MRLDEIKDFIRLQARARTMGVKHPFGSKSHLYMHVGKTAGTSLSRLLVGLNQKGYKTPIVLQHKWTLPMAMIRFPNAKIAVVLRDPLERIVSGFNSRLRQSNEGKPILWSQGEAISFSLFNNAGQFLDACLSDDEFKRSAARFASKEIRHINRGYQYHFVSPELVAKEAGRFYCFGDMASLGEFATALLAPLGSSPAMVEGGLGVHHVSRTNSVSEFARYGEEDIAKLRGFFHGEYAVYNALQAAKEKHAARTGSANS
jgi:hypothetical protein